MILIFQKKVWGTTLEKANEIVYEFFHSQEFKEEKPMVNSLETLTKLKELGFRFIVVTARSVNCILLF